MRIIPKTIKSIQKKKSNTVLLRKEKSEVPTLAISNNKEKPQVETIKFEVKPTEIKKAESVVREEKPVKVETIKNHSLLDEVLEEQAALED